MIGRTPGLGPAILFVLCVGCAPAKMSRDTGVRLSPYLLAANAWLPAVVADSPFAGHPRASEPCSPVAYQEEDGFFEVQTDFCPFGVFVQPLGQGALQGDTLQFTFWHLDLWAAEPAEAQVELWVGAKEIWSRRIPIPGPQDVEVVEQPAPIALPAGESAWLLVTNHGLNSYRLGDVSVAP
jgi:hypothetical protein